MKSLKDISWLVSEDEYRADKALSYSTLAKYERTGFNGLSSLFDKIDTPSLTFGSAVDSIITGGQQEFDERFMVADFPSIKPAVIPVVKSLFSLHSEFYSSLKDIPENIVITVADDFQFQQNWKPETRAKVIKEQAEQYYKLLYLAKDKVIIDTDTYNDVIKAVNALKESPSTGWYFQEDTPFDDYQRFYQLKFKSTFYGIDFKCMADLIIADNSRKVIIPVDLKTSSKPEWDFYKSFFEWRYDIQARLYSKIIRDNIMRDPIFREYTVTDYRFIVVNRKTLTPLVWQYPDTFKKDTLYYGKNKQIIARDPVVIGKELYDYLNKEHKVPIGIELVKNNNINDWSNEI